MTSESKAALKLVSASKVYLSFSLWLALFIGVLILNAHYLEWNPALFIFIGISPLTFASRWLNWFPGLTREAKIHFDKKAIRVNEQEYLLSQLRWYRLDTNSILIHQLVLRFAEKRKVFLTVWADDVVSHQILLDCYQHIKQSEKEMSEITGHNYYKHPVFVVIGWASLISVPVLWISIFLTGLFSIPLLSSMLVWTSIALSMFFMMRRA